MAAEIPYTRPFTERLKLFVETVSMAAIEGMRSVYKLYFAKQFYSFVKFTWNHVSVCIEQDPFFSRYYTDYKLQAYFDGERKDIRAVKKVYAEVSSELLSLDPEG